MDFVSLIISFLGQYPVVGSIIFIIGALRVVFKPLFETVLKAYVEFTPNPEDDKILASIMASPIYVGIAKVLDFVASIKLPVA
jgi:hypothetical protein